MRMRYGIRRWHTVIAAAVSTALACAIAGTVPVAFAQDDDANGSNDYNDVESAESAFRLGHVAIECSDIEAASRERGTEDAGGDAEEAPDQSELDQTPQGCELAVGEPVECAYCIVNQGEEAYIRLASHTVLGELEHVNRIAVIEGDSSGASSEAGGSAEEQDGEASSTVLSGDRKVGWHLAKDGYWYRSVPLGAHESIIVRVSVEIPFERDWTAALRTGQPSMVEETISVDALQSRNKTVDLSAKDPWGMQDRTRQAMGTAEENGGA